MLIVALGALAGLRMGEIIALRWIDVDLPRGRLTVRQNDWRGHMDTPKGGRSGIVDLCQRLADALAPIRRAPGCSPRTAACSAARTAAR